ncbi:MAG TPA: hypothetical protein VI670_20260 [Thermoanaerobaculia bacterium]
MLIQAMPIANIKSNTIHFQNAQGGLSFSIGAASPITGTFSAGQYTSIALPSGKYPVKVGGQGFSNGASLTAPANAVVTYMLVFPIFSAGNGGFIFLRLT